MLLDINLNSHHLTSEDSEWQLRCRQIYEHLDTEFPLQLRETEPASGKSLTPGNFANFFLTLGPSNVAEAFCTFLSFFTNLADKPVVEVEWGEKRIKLSGLKKDECFDRVAKLIHELETRAPSQPPKLLITLE